MKAALYFLPLIVHSVHSFHAGLSARNAIQSKGDFLLSRSSVANNLPNTQNPHLFASESDNEGGADAVATPSKAESILTEFHQSELTFRIVVIGNGAILETTSKLGPKTATSVSPKTGDKLMTFASDDASFEFHVKVDQVCKVTFVATERPNPADGGTKVMRVSRWLSERGTPICSLILADSSEEAVAWFEGMIERHGHEVIM